MSTLLKWQSSQKTFYVKKAIVSIWNHQQINNAKLATLGEVLAYSFWEKYDDTHTVIRLATSWSTTQEDIDKLREVL